MPDVANALKFQKKLRSIEDAYIKQIDQYRAESRRALLEVIDRSGVSNAAVSQMVREIDFLSRRVATLAADTSKDVRTTVANYTRKQLQLAERVGLAKSADIAPVLNKGASIATDGQQSYMTNTSAWLKQLETSLQVQSAKLRISQASKDEINARLLSDSLSDGRASVWAASGNAAASEETTNLWTYGVGLVGAYIAIFNETQPEVQYQKQAVATIDERVTACCLAVHGQIQEIDSPFDLTGGEPRFADEIQDPPFHWYCRTSETLYAPEFESIGITTEEMRDAADAEIKAREETKTRAEITPSHATARRAN